MADLELVDALARLQLAARRSGYRFDITCAPCELTELIELAGLGDALGLRVEPLGQPEEREQRFRVEEERELDDPAV